MKMAHLKAKIVDVGEELAKFCQELEELPGANIHQTLGWAEFQSAGSGRDRFWGIGVYDEEKLIAGTILIKYKLPLGRCWFYSPRGPLGEFELVEMWMPLLIGEVNTLAAEEKAVFWRIDPALRLGEGKFGEIAFWKKFEFKKAHAHYQPENTLLIDLSKSEEEILAEMKPKGRYNIKLAEKKGVEVKKFVAGGEGWEEAVGVFYGLLKETTARDGFAGHGEEYYVQMLAKLGSERASLWLAYYEGVVIAGLILTIFGGVATYYFGASGGLHRNVMAPYLLQWKAILEARGAGMKWYDFLGVAAEGAGDEHPWAGVTDFKLKFGGGRFDYLPALEFVFEKGLYKLMLSGKAANRLKKSLVGKMRKT